jgi:hypothetical protein
LNHTSKLKLFSPLTNALHLGVWQISNHPNQAGAEHSGTFDANQSSWVVTTARQAKVTVQRGLSLRHLLQASLKACEVDWPLRDVSSRFSEPSIRLNLFLPDHHFHTFQMPCMPQWGRQDIEAESRLEAARLMRRPLESLSLDFEVQTTPEGTMMVSVMVCESSLVQAASAMFEKLGFQLNSLTSHSDLQAYAHSWNVPPDLLMPMVHGTAAAC